MAKYDLTQKLIPFLDRHLVFPLLVNLGETGLFPAEQINLAHYELAKGTNMVDYIESRYAEVWPGKELPEGTVEA